MEIAMLYSRIEIEIICLHEEQLGLQNKFTFQVCNDRLFLFQKRVWESLELALIVKLINFLRVYITSDIPERLYRTAIGGISILGLSTERVYGMVCDINKSKKCI